jgi:SAM-dependent methyltransferase
MKPHFPHTEAPRCPICSGSTDQASSRNHYAYWRCVQCGTAHLHPPPSTDFFPEFYDTFHLPAIDGGIFEDFEIRASADFPAKARIVMQSLANLGAPQPGAVRVLDVGCGKGHFVRELHQLGLQAEGIDLSVRAVNEGKKLGIEGLHAGRLEQRSDWELRFDAVTSFATIEHVPCPAHFLKATSFILKPGGLLFLDTGLADDAVDRWAPGLIQWYDAPQHLFVFSCAGMKRLLQEAGFTVLRVDAHFERNQWRRIAKYLRNRFLALAGGILFRLSLGRRTFERMRMETKMPFGSLMFIVARRNSVP